MLRKLVVTAPIAMLVSSAAVAQETLPVKDPETIDQAIDVDPAIVLGKIEAWVVGFQKLLPNIVVAVVVFGLFVVAAWLVRKTLGGWAKRRDRDNLGDVLGSFLKWMVILTGALIALTIVIPSLKPGDLVAGLGIGSVAIGFAFKDILQNWLAGLLLLFRQPFRPGDQIVVSGYEGTVQRIETRATLIKTYDGRLVILPNADVYSSAVTVNTAHATRRSDYDVGIGYGDSIADAREAILAALRDIEGINATPEPEVLVWDLASSAVNLRVRWWTKSMRTDVVHTRAAALEAIKAALDAAGVDMPYDTQVLLFHDQSEQTDGRRGEQREGWPRRPGHEPPEPAARDRKATVAPNPSR